MASCDFELCQYDQNTEKKSKPQRRYDMDKNTKREFNTFQIKTW